VELRGVTSDVQVRFEDSARIPGLQVADVIANTVHHAFGASSDATRTRAVLAECLDASVLEVVEISEQWPDWPLSIG
jgi:hypothetical protein